MSRILEVAFWKTLCDEFCVVVSLHRLNFELEDKCCDTLAD